jgi:hypothetical protein
MSLLQKENEIPSGLRTHHLVETNSRSPGEEQMVGLNHLMDYENCSLSLLKRQQIKPLADTCQGLFPLHA